MTSSNFFALGLQNAPEVIEPIQLPIQGSLPSWLSGTLYRTGPGTFRIESNNNKNGHVDVHHWFNGLGMNHKFEILENGTEVWYSCRKSAKGLEQQISEKGTDSRNFLKPASDPCEAIFAKFSTTYSKQRPDNVNVSVTLTPNMAGLKPASHSNVKNGQILSHIVSKTDSTSLQVLDPDTLEPLSHMTYYDLDPRLEGQTSAAHSCTDEQTGDFFNFVLSVGKSRYTVFCIRGGLIDEKERNRIDILATITDAPAAYIHSSFMTEKYLILTIWQADFSTPGANVQFMQDTIDKRWNPNRPTLYYVIDRRKGGVVAKYKSDAYFAFHTINSYEDNDDDLVLDVSTYSDHSTIWHYVLHELRNPEKYNYESRPGTARRYRLRNVSAGSPDEFREAEMIFDTPSSKNIELPTIHPNRYHKRHRYAYGISKAKATSIISDRLIKLDLDHPNIASDSLSYGVAIWTELNCAPGEPIFVSDPDGTEEDDGVLLSVVLDGVAGRSMLLAVNAKNMKEVGRAAVDHPIPFGFHGVFVDTSHRSRL